MEMKVLDIDGVMLAVDAVRDEIMGVRSENAALRGRLRESRRENRQLMQDCAAAQARATRDAEYWRQMMLAVCGLTVAAVCLLHTVVICWALG